MFCHSKNIHVNLISKSSPGKIYVLFSRGEMRAESYPRGAGSFLERLNSRMAAF